MSSLIITFKMHWKKVTQNNTGMYTNESSQWNFKIPNNNFDAIFDNAYQNHNCQTIKYYRPDRRTTYTTTYNKSDADDAQPSHRTDKHSW